MVYFHRRGEEHQQTKLVIFGGGLLNHRFRCLRYTISLPLTPLQAPSSDRLEFHPFRVLSSTALSIGATYLLLATIRLPKGASVKPMCGYANEVQSSTLYFPGKRWVGWSWWLG